MFGDGLADANASRGFFGNLAGKLPVVAEK
jgi:hypothetical protein